MSKFKIVNFKKNRDQKIYTIHHDYEKVPKQDEQVNSLCIWDYKLKIGLKGYYT